MARTYGGVPSKNSDKTIELGRHVIESAYYGATKSAPVGLNIREKDFSYLSYNDAIALFKYMMDGKCTQLDIALFIKMVLKHDEWFSERGFEAGWDYAARVTNMKNPNINIEYKKLHDIVYTDWLITSRLEDFLKAHKKSR